MVLHLHERRPPEHLVLFGSGRHPAPGLIEASRRRVVAEHPEHGVHLPVRCHVVFFNRDQDGYLLLNLGMLTTSGEPRTVIEDNYWLNRGNPDDLECPPSGKLLRVSYSNGDMVRVEFRELTSLEEAAERYPDAYPDGWGIDFPITAVEVHLSVGGTDISFGPRETSLGGLIVRNCFMSRCGAGISIG